MEKIYSPEFIPYYVDVVKKYKLNDCQALVYWFIRFYTSGGNQFWFKNEQLWEILDRSSASINLALWVLEKKNLIEREMTILSANGSKRKISLVNNILTSTVNKIWTSTVNNIIASKENIKENINNNKSKVEDKTTAQSILDYYKWKFKGNKKKHKRAVAISRILDRLKTTSEPLIIKAIDSYFEAKDINEPQFIKPCENFFGYEPWTKIKFIEWFLDDIKEVESLNLVCLQDLTESQLSERIWDSLEDILAFKREIRDEFMKLPEIEQIKFKALLKKVEDLKLTTLWLYK